MDDNFCFGYTSVYMDALKDHVITNAAGGKTICMKKHNFPDTGLSLLAAMIDTM